MHGYYLSETDRINDFLRQNAPLTLREAAEMEIMDFYTSKKRMNMLLGERYYMGDHDILKRRRTAIGQGGKVVELDNLPNNRIVNNVYKMLVDQKVNYLLGKPVVLNCANEQKLSRLKQGFNRNFLRLLRRTAEDSLNCGIGWLYGGCDKYGQPTFKRFRPWEVVPVWSDSEHTALDYAIRLYSVVKTEGKRQVREKRVELFTTEGVKRYKVQGGILKEESRLMPYAAGMKKGRIPLEPFRYNSKEIPLIKNVKTLQDGLNSLISDFQNCMEEDVRNTILVIKNYDGEDLGQFRKNLSAYGAVKVKTVDGSQGGVETLNIEVNGENYKAIIDMFKKAIIENGRGYDAKNDKLSGTPNQLNIMSMYNDIDIDANGMETEFSAALENLFSLWEDCSDVEFVFNRSMIMNEGEVIDNIIKSRGFVDDKLLMAKHPYIN